MFRFIGYIDGDADQVATVTLPLIPLRPMNALRVARQGSKLLLQFEQRVVRATCRRLHCPDRLLDIGHGDGRHKISGSLRERLELHSMVLLGFAF